MGKHTIIIQIENLYWRERERERERKVKLDITQCLLGEKDEI